MNIITKLSQQKMSYKLFIINFLSLFSLYSYSETKAYWTDFYNVEWTTPSFNSSESMPFGGGDIGCNAWVENGDILLYIQRSGCFSENGEYLKMGRIRLTMSPNPLKNLSLFRQTLILKEGCITINATGNIDNKDINVTVRLWTDIFTHSVHITIDSDEDIGYIAAYENWRFEDKLLLDENRGRFGCFGLEGYPKEVVKLKDSCAFNNNNVLFFHKNPEHTLSPEVMIEQQGLTKYKDEITNNIKNLTFGGLLLANNAKVEKVGNGMYCGTPYKSWSLTSNKKSKTHHITVVTYKAQESNLAVWKEELDNICKEVQKTNGEIDKNKKWWNDFWDKSYIIITPSQQQDSLLWQVGRNYQLMRYQLGCNMYGDYPSKFNGGNFTFDPILVNKEMTHDPDWRQWGGDVFTAQNQRLLYWPMLKAGDFDGMISQFNLYEWGLPGAMAKVKKYFDHQGAMYCEYANAPGLDIASGWGWDNKANIRKRGTIIDFGDPRADATKKYNEIVENGIMANGSIAYHWESQIEHAYMILEYHRFSNVNIDKYIPFIKQSLTFFDEHYKKRELLRTGKELDENGKLVFFPSTSCESYRGATNPTDLISGIRSCLESLLLIKTKAISAEDKRYFREYLSRLPEINWDVIDGDTIATPAVSYLKYQNCECPQFYPLFPFNSYSFQDKEMEYFRNAWIHGTFPKNMIISWHQDGIFFARMRMTKEAMLYLEQKMKNSDRRFPTFWGPGHDWVPDHNWGGSGMIGVQEMLMQTFGNKIYILPSWPKGINVEFKLYAPHNTTVKVNYYNGKIKELTVIPKEREKDVIIMLN